MYGEIAKDSIHIIDCIKLTKAATYSGFIHETLEGDKSVPYIYIFNKDNTVEFYSLYTKTHAQFE